MKHLRKSVEIFSAGRSIAILIFAFTSHAFADTTPKFVYLLNDSAGNISAYTIDSSTGILTVIPGSPFAAGLNVPVSIAVDPSNRFVYVVNNGSSSVSAYGINSSTGVLTAVVGSPFSTGTQPWSVAVDPSGKFIYVANQGGNISAFTINTTTGGLTAVSGSPFADGTGTYPESVAVDPSGKFVYVANNNTNSVSAFTINSSTGALTTVSGSPFAAGTNPFGVAVNPSGTFIYVANTGPNPPVGFGNVSAYAIDRSTGALTEISGSPFAAGLYPRSVAIDPAGKFAYVADEFSDNISAYTINSSTGALNAISGSPFAGGTYPSTAAVDPSGKFAFVANQGITAPSGNISAYTIDSTGALAPVVGSPFGVGFVCGCGDSGPVSVAIAGQSTVRFAAFKVAAEIDPQKHSFDVAGEFTLGPSSNEINPLTQPVTLQVGTFSTTIPAGSFRGGLGLTFAYNGVLSGVQLDVVILNVGGDRFLFAAQGIGANLTGTVNPVTVALTIGDDSGSTTVKADVE